MPEPAPGAPSSAFYRLIRLLSRPVFAVLFRLRREGLEGLPRAPLILAANHVSYLDPAVVGSTFPRPIRFLIHEAVWSKPGQTWFYRWMRAIPVDRTGVARVALREALLALSRGEVVGIFPEGGRVDPGSADPALAGVALLARKSGASVVPVGIVGTDKAMPRGVALPRPLGIRVRYGRPMAYDEVTAGLDEGGRAADLAFTEELMRRVRELAGIAESSP